MQQFWYKITSSIVMFYWICIRNCIYSWKIEQNVLVSGCDTIEILILNQVKTYKKRLQCV